MAKASLSTMWAQGRFERLSDFAAAAQRLGFQGIEVNYMVSPDALEELLASNPLAIPSLHAPMPRVRAGDGRWSEELNLAASDEEERRLALARAVATIEWAARVGARYVVLHLGSVGNEVFAAERRLRQLYDAGTREGEEVAALREACRRQRAEGAPLHLAKARETLGELAGEAARHGVALGLENRYHYHEIPSVDEAQELLADYPPGLAGYWHDVGHAEVMDRLGLVEKGRWLGELGPRCLGSHLHDVEGIGDHRPPGRGDADWEYVAGGLPATALRVLEINQRTPEELVGEAIPFLQKRGVL